jgi:hypothetical protein
MKAALALVALVGCSGGSKSSPSNTSTAPDVKPAPIGVYGGAEYGGYKRTPQLAAFRDLVAGKSVAEACPISKDLQAAATAIQAAPTPLTLASDPGGIWAGETTELAGLAGDFVTQCTGKDTAMTGDTFAAMNRSFQRLLLSLK